MLGSKAATYAVLAVIEIARRAESQTRGLQAADLASRFELPSAYVAKVMTLLARASLLVSNRGPQGGFRLSRPADQIALLEVIEAVDGRLAPSFGKRFAPAEDGALRRVQSILEDAIEQLRGHLSVKTVRDCLDEPPSCDAAPTHGVPLAAAPVAGPAGELPSIST